MRGIILGLVIGLVVGAAGGWFLSQFTTVKGLEKQLADEKALSKTNSDQLEKLKTDYEELSKSSEADLALAGEKLAGKDTRIGELEAANAETASKMDKLKAENDKLLAAVEEYKKKYGEVVEETAEKKPVNPDEEYGKKVQELFKRITPVGGPLNPLAVKELGLDEGQVAGINDLLKDEAGRMRKRLLEWAAELIEGKTAEELGQLSELKLAYEVGRHVSDEIEQVQKLKPEQLRTLHIENHFIKFLPKDAKLVRIARSLYEERKKTYGGLAAYLSEEQEKTFKEKYFQSGTFVFPHMGSFGIGNLTDEDFQK